MNSFGVVEFGVFHQGLVILNAYLVNNSIPEEVGNKFFKRLNTNTTFLQHFIKKGKY